MYVISNVRKSIETLIFSLRVNGKCLVRVPTRFLFVIF